MTDTVLMWDPCGCEPVTYAMLSLATTQDLRFGHFEVFFPGTTQRLTLLSMQTFVVVQDTFSINSLLAENPSIRRDCPATPLADRNSNLFQKENLADPEKELEMWAKSNKYICIWVKYLPITFLKYNKYLLCIVIGAGPGSCHLGPVAATESLDFHGTFKIHGANISIVYNSPGSWHIQSRNRTLSLKNDVCGCFAWLSRVPLGQLAPQIGENTLWKLSSSANGLERGYRKASESTKSVNPSSYLTSVSTDIGKISVNFDMYVSKLIEYLISATFLPMT
jgi:hypothetical protein